VGTVVLARLGFIVKYNTRMTELYSGRVAPLADPPRAPLVTVILPTYNRATFLPKAFESLLAQSFSDWDVIVVDDGSTDRTREIVEQFSTAYPGRVRYVFQDNHGAYSARNRGLLEAGGQYIAFFDSDDLWLPHHLERCVSAFQRHPEIDWVFGACRQVEQSTGRTIEPSTFYVGGKARPFLHLKTEYSDGLRIIRDPNVVECQILHGLYCGLQNSVIKRQLFDGRRFDEQSRVVDDEMFVIRVLAAGARFAYFLEPHVIYQVHDANSSGSAAGASTDKTIAIFQEMVAALEQLATEVSLSEREHRALMKRLGYEYFWHLGYGGYWQAGRRREALDSFRLGLSAWPWGLNHWKTYLLARVRVALDRPA
jgi:glycosyltransferase involved in cell wall biosynthesis